VISLHQGTMMMERRDGLAAIVALPLAAKDAPLTVRANTPDYTGGFCPALVAFSDLLPEDAFAYLDVE